MNEFETWVKKLSNAELILMLKKSHVEKQILTQEYLWRQENKLIESEIEKEIKNGNADKTDSRS